MPTPFDNFSFEQNPVNQDEGIARVNLNMGQTGAFAYKDSQGKTVLTNMAIDATGKESKIGSIGNTPTVPTEGTAAENPAPTYANTPDVRSSLFAGLDKLRKSNNPAEASAMYDSLVQSLTGEMARMEAEAQNLAQSKYGVPFLQKNLDAARAADKADPLYSPGLGDSPVTQRIVTEMRQAGESARAESQQFLRTNMSWNSLATVKAQADREYQRIQKIADSQTQLTLNKQMTADNAAAQATLQQTLRREDRAEKQKEELVAGYNQLNGTQIRNISLLSADEIGGLEDGSEEKKIRIAEKAFKNKDKAFVAAISAERPDEKLSLALQGNTYARKLVTLEESERLGLPVAEVDKMVKDMHTRLAAFDARKYLSTKPGTREDKESMLAQLNAGQLDISKRSQSEQMRVTLFMQEQQKLLQANFDNDVGTWRVPDPTLQTMLTTSVQKARKIAGKSDIKNVMAAYLDDGPDDQRLLRANQFVSAMRMASDRFQGSAFGQPDYLQTKAAIEREGISNGWWMRAVRAMQQANRAVPSSNLLAGDSSARNLAFNPMLPVGDVLSRAVGIGQRLMPEEAPLRLDDSNQPIPPESQVRR